MQLKVAGVPLALAEKHQLLITNVIWAATQMLSRSAEAVVLPVALAMYTTGLMVLMIQAIQIQRAVFTDSSPLFFLKELKRQLQGSR